MNILLVEDNNIAQKILTRMLKEKGHIIDIANKGQPIKLKKLLTVSLRKN